MGRFRVDINILKAGQPRAYADSVYEADILFKNWWDSTSGEREGTWCPNEDSVKKIAQILVRGFVEKPTHGLDPRLESISKTGKQSYHVKIVEPYCD